MNDIDKRYIDQLHNDCKTLRADLTAAQERIKELEAERDAPGAVQMETKFISELVRDKAVLMRHVIRDNDPTWQVVYQQFVTDCDGEVWWVARLERPIAPAPAPETEADNA